MLPTTAPLSPSARRRALAALAAEPLDVLVVGAGVVGAGCALDAVTRGLRVGLVEARDYASGTSSRSSKLVHGGLRYLKQLDVGLVREALRERDLILNRLCPYLARPVPFLYPLERRAWDRAYVGLGLGVYDVLGAGRGVPGHCRHLTRKQALRSFRGADPTVVRGGILFYEGQLDDARHTMVLARTAMAHGALVASSARVTGFLQEGERVVGAAVRDLETGAEIRVRARVVINASGVWTDDIQQTVGDRGRFRVQASKGVHLVIPRTAIDSDTGLITETATSLLFVIPCSWDDDFWIIGTTDTPWNLDRAHPAASRADIEYLVAQANRLLATPLTVGDVVGVYAGLRPLLAGEHEQTSALSRQHAVDSPVPGLVVVAGGKYTTYRVMAADTVDAAARQLGGRVAPSCTAEIPLLGADGYRSLANARQRLALEHDLPLAVVDRLLARYGTEVLGLLATIDADPGLGTPLGGAPKYLRAEARFAVSHEGALHLDDILARRLRVSIDTPSRGTSVAREVAELAADLLGWDDETIDREIARYAARVAAERESQSQSDDQAADASRLEAPDTRFDAPSTGT